jgi:hypothetical protein
LKADSQYSLSASVLPRAQLLPLSSESCRRART